MEKKSTLHRFHSLMFFFLSLPLNTQRLLLIVHPALTPLYFMIPEVWRMDLNPFADHPDSLISNSARL